MSLSNPNRTTAFPKALHDPLSINLRRQTELLLSHIPTTSTHYATITGASNAGELLSALSSALATPAFTKIVALLFRPLLVDLCARWIQQNPENVEQHLVALCCLVEVHEEIFPILYHVLLHQYEEGPLAFLADVDSVTSIDAIRLQRLVLAYYRILQANRELPYHSNWPLVPLSKLMWTPDLHNGVRLLAIRCYSLQSQMGEAERLKIEKEILGEPCGVDCPLNYGQDLNGADIEVDGWIMPVTEVNRIRQERNDIVTKPIDFYSLNQGVSPIPLEESHLSPFVINVHGVLLLRSSDKSAIFSGIVPTSSSANVLQQLAIHYSLRLPTLLTSAPSAGKALLLTHLASLIHPENQNQVITIHLADTSLDPRSLLGSYISSTIHPGTFEWKEGVLARSMREGKWVVLKDVDRGSSEVLGVLKPLVESLELGKWIGGRARLTVPSRGVVIAHDDFRLFGTRSTLPSRDGAFHSPTFFGSHKFSEIVMASPSPEELSFIIDAKFPRLAGDIAGALIRMWEAVRQAGNPSAGREIGLRDLEKFCRRVDALLPTHRTMDISMESGQQFSMMDIFPHPEVREEIFVEARDVFFGFGPPTSTIQAHIAIICQIIGEHLGLGTERQGSALQKPPIFEISKNANGQIVAIQARRHRLSAQPTKMSLQSEPSRPFAMHGPAVSLMSRIAIAVSHSEPILLTGETGTGKTSAVTQLASLLNQSLISLNLSHQTESSDLIGGLKPIDVRVPGSLLQEKFVDLFGATFSRRKNEKFDTEVRKAVGEAKWKRAVGLWKESVRMALERIQAKQSHGDPGRASDNTPRKRRKTGNDVSSLGLSWANFLHEVEEFEIQHVQGKGRFAFGFVEGPLVKALKAGCWVLLDEVNLASPETLECLSSLLQGPAASITLTEHGFLEPVPRHPNFRLFACMNPATDIGKKDLPPTIRARFTEIDVPSPDTDKETLLTIITQYIGHIALGDKKIMMDIAEFYLAVKQVVSQRQIADGANHRPHFSMRTLARALTFAADIASAFSLRRAVWEGCLMGFTMILDGESAEVVTKLAKKHLLPDRNFQSMLAKEPPPPRGVSIKFGPFYLAKGPLEEDLAEDYIITPSVAQKLVDLSRIILTRRFPVLIEGPTSSGKTSSIEYLARRTGHQFVRINNHEHTDIQEYIGSYVSDPFTGKLIFKDGLLVQALRHGHWIVLDELNLAPSDVLEALNRLLDDNRELVIPETQEVVRPHPHFLLFATQNPPGLYGGRKILSRAFRNRFLEVHFSDVPQIELETILCQRCRIAPSYGKKIVNVFRELQKRRQSGRVFESKQGFATLRDLFRWAGRDVVQHGYQELAENGYMLLAERVRKEEDKAAVKEVIEKEMGVRIDVDVLYDFNRAGININSFLGVSPPLSSSVVWTKAMQRLYTLVTRALKYNEPVLLVGETGCGKTSVCQLFAEATMKRLVTVNCHQNTETADIIGGLRPIRNRVGLQAEAVKDAIIILKEVGLPYEGPLPDSVATALNNVEKNKHLDTQLRERVEEVKGRLSRSATIFEWYNGPLVEAMDSGDVFLLDEISLADDSVLERLNSVLEAGRSIVLAEKGGINAENPCIRAAPDFKLLATMNPGGDFGKKELSPALRNRFTEIWVPSVNARHDLEMIINDSWINLKLRKYTNLVLEFIDWLSARLQDLALASIRDILAWVHFTNSVLKSNESSTVSTDELFHHAAYMIFLDGLSSLPQLAGCSRETVRVIKGDAVQKLQTLVPLSAPIGTSARSYEPSKFIQFGSFAIKRGVLTPVEHHFNFRAPTTLDNVKRVVRSFQAAKPILMEGSPGVGKTSLVTALANVSGHHLCRINLSDQTDLVDLFGSDLPIEGGAPGEFAWKDAEFLEALQNGHWVLLDEMNLAPQAVLEGLNAVLDHRGTVYIPELNKSFKRHPEFRIFAAQNPLSQGGGRKGLPKSFINRFNKVYLEELNPADLLQVCSQIFASMEESVLSAMISFNLQLNGEVAFRRSFAQDGSPWEFNLRDILRWATLSTRSSTVSHPADFLQSSYLQRFRTEHDRQHALHLFNQTCSTTAFCPRMYPTWTIGPNFTRFGSSTIRRLNHAPISRPRRILKSQISTLESLSLCLEQSWLAILTGARDTGKTSIVRALASFTGNSLREVTINPTTDTMDILGGFEQVDTRKRLAQLLDQLLQHIELIQSSSHGSRNVASNHHSLRRLRKNCDNTVHRTADLAQRVSVLISTLPSTYDLQAFDAPVQHLLHSLKSAGQFQWVDGPLVTAMRQGHWILLDGANLCNSSVLDRLNSLCEPDGALILSERGFVNGEVITIKPHPNFKLFMTVDPHFGELSRAMRNRGLELFMMNSFSEDDQSSLHDFQRLPTFSDDEVSPGSRFELFRRGLAIDGYSISLSVPTGRHLDQDTALASLLDGAPRLFASLSHLDSPSAWIHFFSRMAIPRTVPYLRRYLKELPHPPEMTFQLFAESYPNPQLDFMMLESRRVFSERENIPYTLIHDLPLYFYWAGSLPNHSMSTRLAGPHRPSVILDILALNATVLLLQSSSLEVPQKPKTVAPKTAQVLLLASELANTVHTMATSFMSGHITTSSPGVITTLLSFCVYLRQALDSGPCDFSALYAISEWFQECIPRSDVAFSHVVDLANSLHHSVSPSRGLGFFNLWASVYHAQPAIEKMETARKTEKALSGPVGTSRLRRQAFYVMSLETLPERVLPQEVQKFTLSELRSSLDECLNVEISSHFVEMYEMDVAITLLGLQLLSRPQRSEQQERNLLIMEEMTRILSNARHTSLVHALPFQHLVWSSNANSLTEAIWTQAQLVWLENLWVTSLGSGAQILGPTIVNRSILFSRTLETCNMHRVPSSAIVGREALISSQAQTILVIGRDKVSRFNQLVGMLLQTFGLIATFYSSTFELSTLSALQNTVFKEQDHAPAMIDEALTRLWTSSDRQLKEAVSRLRSVLEKHQATQSIECLVSLIWIHVGLLFLDQSIPDVPLDPSAIQRAKLQRLQDDTQNLSTQIQLHEELENVLTGSSKSGIAEILKERLQEVQSQSLNMHGLPLREDTVKLQTFWAEVQQFEKVILDPSKLLGLLNALISGEEGASEREMLTQDSLSGFSQRLDSIYDDFADITLLLKLGIGHIRLGLRLLAETCQTQTRTGPRYNDRIVTFPVISHTQSIIRHFPEVEPDNQAVFFHILLALSAATSELELGYHDAQLYATVELANQQALRLWLIDQAKGKQADIDSNTLYRRRQSNYDATSDAQLEEEEFLSIFPTFEEALEQTSHSELGQAVSTSVPLLVQPPDVKAMLHSHLDLVEAQLRNHHTSRTNQRIEQLASNGIQSLLHRFPTTSPSSLDRVGISTQIVILHDTHSSLTADRNTSTTYDFYNDSNYREVKRAADVLLALRNRLEVISRDWPDQMVLKHLIDKCDIILEIAAVSPVAKILTMIEQLLLQTDDWEAYANRDNSIKPQREELVNLVISWRRLELSCWQSLLDSQAANFVDEDSTWWFRLYDAAIRVPLSFVIDDISFNADPLGAYLATLVPLLNDFMNNSPLGLFEARLRLLRSFVQYAALVSPTKSTPERTILGRITRILHSTWIRYHISSRSLQEYLLGQKAILQKDIKDLIKLASWKDVNVHALQQSARKTHHQLYKIIRKFRDLLKEPIQHRLRPEPAGEAEASALCTQITTLSTKIDDIEERQLDDNIFSSHHKAHLVNLTKTLSRFQGLANTRIIPFVRVAHANRVEEIAVTVITTSRALSSLEVPANLSGEQRERYAKSLLVRKRKAWSDLLKELKFSGLTSNPKPELLRQHADLLWMLEQPILSSPKQVDMERGEIYCVKLCMMLPVLRASLPVHHSDLTTRELKRGEGFLEVGFSLAVDLRSRLALALDDLNRVEKAKKRLNTLNSAKVLIVVARPQFSALVATLGRVAHSLSELRHHLLLIKQLAIDVRVPEDLHNEVDHTAEISASLHNRCRDVLVDLNLSECLYLTNDEHDLIATSSSLVASVNASISIWAEKHPDFGYLFDPLQSWMSNCTLTSSVQTDVQETGPNQVEALIDMLLVSVQTLAGRCSFKVDEDNDLTDDQSQDYILKGYTQVCEFTEALNLANIAAQLGRVLASLHSWPNGETFLVPIFSFLEVYFNIAREQIMALSNWTKTLLKLDFILCSLLTTLCEKGFCKPPDNDEEGPGTGVESADTDGMGIGEGSGIENVSKEIEDESQVEGLKGQEDDNGGGDTNGDDAVEMNEDFGGALEDISDDEEEDENKSGDDQQDIEEALGDLESNDPTAVDEKLWGDEKGPEDNPGNEGKADEDHSKEHKGPSDVVAKETHENHEEPRSLDDVKNLPETEQTDGVDDPQDENNAGVDETGPHLEEHTQDANTLDLSEDMDLDDDLKDANNDAMADDVDDAGSPEEQLSLGEDAASVKDEDLADSGTKDNEDAGSEDAEEDDPGPDSELMATNEEDVESHSDPLDSITARPDLSNGNGTTDPSNSTGQKSGEHDVSKALESDLPSEGVNQDSTIEDTSPNDSSVPQSEMNPDPSNAANEGSSTGVSAARAGQAQPHKSTTNTLPNPLRSLGDTLQQIRQQFDEILNSRNEDVTTERIGDTSLPSQLEYLQPEDQDHDMQALGPSGEEQVAKLEQLNLIDDELQAEEQVAPMEVDEQIANNEPLKARSEDATRSEEETIPMDSSEAGESVLRQSKILDNVTASDGELAGYEEPGDSRVEAKLRDWRSADYPEKGAEQLWRLYESMTHDLAYTLCEQLRLILQPTLASRLKGDYRTGKRLNMKKVIAYIASDYTKDKIWLRRTKPSQREYQVLISIDDSRSMAESHSIHLAYQTLALIAKSLTRLESGDVAIAKFGEAVDLLRGFDQGPFNESAGAQLLSAFRFNQKATNVLSLIETSLQYLDGARERKAMSSTSAADLWQLQIIISDGMCQDHDKIRRLLRKAEEQRVMIVFIVLDSHQTRPAEISPRETLTKQHSILDMEKVDFKTIDGKMELIQQKYLDSFPFEYYVVLRNVEALPEVLSETLKQFLERISGE
ncbi:hypothetical protein CPB83DRAFT_903057 [Crepidotus variabilis]|uniref:Midasin n=1 Tax=Crepidotus variabilis TaxID=179855 RepID=A0A9P6ENL6_9AGAR|nr:hypothetical protein CPB83DRAFT_903057 [Crepidotus variabilis]